MGLFAKTTLSKDHRKCWVTATAFCWKGQAIIFSVCCPTVKLHNESRIPRARDISQSSQLVPYFFFNRSLYYCSNLDVQWHEIHLWTFYGNKSRILTLDADKWFCNRRFHRSLLAINKHYYQTRKTALTWAYLLLSSSFMNETCTYMHIII